MARPVKKPIEQWEKEILDAAQKFFITKGFEETSISDIMEAVGGAKGMFYRCFKSKEEVMNTLSKRMFLEKNPFELVKKRTDLNSLQKIRELLLIDRSDKERNELNMQAISILKDPKILAAAIEANTKTLTPLWFELLEEGRKDGSIQTEYAKELSELLPLINFWLMPSIYPATTEEILHKYQFIVEVLSKMGLPIWDNKSEFMSEKILSEISSKRRE